MNALIIIGVLGVIVMLGEAFRLRKVLPVIIFTGLALAAVLAVVDWDTNSRYYSDTVYFDNYALFFTVLLIVSVMIWFLSSFIKQKEGIETHRFDHYALVLFSTFGAVCLAVFSDLSVMFLGIEIMSIPLYVLAGSDKRNLASNEASVKYFMLGAFATGFLLLGITFVYGALGTFNIQEISELLAAGYDSLPMYFYAGVLLMLVGMLFKISAVPFHFWAPDVYQGTPVIYTSFMATVVKAAGLVALYRLLTGGFMPAFPMWEEVLVVISILTIVVGNLTAVRQKDIKRLFAFSGISHVGYFLFTLFGTEVYSSSSAIFYITAYVAATLLAFSVIIPVIRQSKSSHIDAFKGLAKKDPYYALGLTVALLSLAGIPPLAGFFAKYYVFLAVLEAGYDWLVIAGIFGSLVGVYYYFKIIILMYAKQPVEAASSGSMNVFGRLALLTAVIAVILLGIMPDILTDILRFL